MAYRVLNSASDPQRIIRALCLSRALQEALQVELDRIWSAVTFIGLSHAHGRALGAGLGLGLVNAVTPAQFNILAATYTRALEDRLEVLMAQA